MAVKNRVKTMVLQTVPVRMDAIKKKMQAMKVEKDNAMDRCDTCEEAARVAKV
jgi:hypothetical protein